MLYALGFNAFIISNGVITGGVSGICALIFFATDELIPISMSYSIINIALLAIALRVLGMKFLVRSIIGVAALALWFMLFERIAPSWNLLEGEPFMSILIGSGFCGVGLGLIFTANGSTGGTDILAAIINKYRNVSIGRALLIFDFFIIGSSYLLFRDIDRIVFGFVEMALVNYLVDIVINGKAQSVQFLIFSRKHDEISAEIIKQIGRGCTLLDGVGGYSGNSVKVVVVLAKKSESVSIFRLVKQIDHSAFISQSIVSGVYGEGFDQIKA